MAVIPASVESAQSNPCGADRPNTNEGTGRIRLDAARQFRNETLYGDAAPAPEGELRQLLADVGALLDRHTGAASGPAPGAA